MKKFKEIFYVILILYLILSIFIILSSDRLNDRYGLLQINTFMFIWVAIGVFTMCLGFIYQILNQRQLNQKNALLEKELARIKIKLFDESELKEEEIKSTKTNHPLIDEKTDQRIGSKNDPKPNQGTDKKTDL